MFTKSQEILSLRGWGRELEGGGRGPLTPGPLSQYYGKTRERLSRWTTPSIWGVCGNRSKGWRVTTS